MIPKQVIAITILCSAGFSWVCFMWPHIAGLIFGGCWIAAIVWMLIELWARINQ